MLFSDPFIFVARMDSLSQLIQHAALAFSVISLFAVIIWHHMVLQRKMRPGPPIWPIMGMLPSVFLHVNDIYDWVTQVLTDCGGTLEFKPPWLANMFSFVTTDPKSIEYILKTKFRSFPKGSYYKCIFDDLLGQGILNTDGEQWAWGRKTMSSFLHSPALKNHMIATIDKSIHCKLLAELEEAARSGSAIDLQEILIRFALDNLCTVGLGVDLCSLNPPGRDVEIAKAFEEAMDATISRFIIPYSIWKTMRFLGVGTERKLKASLQTIDEFAAEAIRIRRKEMLQDHQNVERRDMLSNLMMLRGDGDHLLSDKVIRDMCINFVLAGRDTTAIALSWFFWLLIQHPNVEENILSELRQIVVIRRRGSNPTSCSFKGFTLEEVKEMQYLHAALSETLRLYPSLPINYKEVIEDEVLPNGARLKKGTNLIFPIYSMGRTENIWGKDCMEFKPERWLREGVFVPEGGYKYPVFNAGPRVCLGKDFAYLLMKWVAASLVYRYRLKLAKEVMVEPKLGITLCLKNGLPVTLHPRSEMSKDH